MFNFIVYYEETDAVGNMIDYEVRNEYLSRRPYSLILLDLKKMVPVRNMIDDHMINE